ncbi:MAG: tetratricopeptide repeat protein [Clostridia bacterium]|nr:tetratricopeptide repeat protein [Clostridia bacterium]
MKVRSKSGAPTPRAARVFTDREEPRKSFWKKYNQVVSELAGEECNVHVLTYYGIGGIGKSSLLRKLISEIEEEITKPRYLYFDFNIYQESRAVLDKIKNKLEDDYKYHFPLFDLGSYVYAKKIGEKADSLEVKQLTERSPVLSFMTSVAGNLPIVGIATQVLSLADQGIAMIRTHLKQHSRELAQIEYMEAEELYNYLPYLFSEDMASNLEKETEPFVFFLDTYERVVNELSQVGEPLKNDEWIRGEEGLIQNIPGVLWVIAGREKLKWEKFDPEWAGALEQHILGSLSVADSDQFLASAGVGGTELRSAIYKLTGGTPVYLDLCVDQFMRIVARGEVPTIDMFGNNTFDLIERFARYMGEAQKDLVFMLSCLKHWSDELIGNIGGKILPNFSLSTYEKAKEFSFIVQSDDGYYNIHQTVGEVLMGDCPKVLKDRVANCLIEHFREEIAEQAFFAPRYVVALNYVMQAGMMKYPDDEEFRAFYEEYLRTAVMGLARAGRFDQAEAIFEILRERAEKLPESRIHALAMMYQAYVDFLRGEYDPEATLAGEAWELYKKLLGEDHPDSLRALSSMGDILTDAPDKKRALEIDRLVWEKRKAILGEDHPDTLDAMGKVSVSMSLAGDDWGALELKKEVLDRRMKVLGEEHPETIKAMGNLATTLSVLGFYQDALELKEKVLALRKKVMGEEHLATLRAMNSLAITLETLGESKRALELKAEVLEKRRAILGEGHPQTLSSMNSLAIALENKGDYKASLELKTRVLEERIRIYGEEHPDTLSAKASLAVVLWHLDRQDESLVLEEEVLEKRRKILGNDHLDTLSAMNNLAVTLEEMGEYARSLDLKREVFERRQRLLGENHLDTISAMNNLAVGLEGAGELEKALEMKEEVLRRRLLILGENHVETTKARNNLATAYAKQKRYDEALEQRLKVLEVRRAILGSDHPDTLFAILNLANLYWLVGQKEKTAELETELLERRMRVLGEDHLSTISTAYNLSVTLDEIGGDKETVLSLREGVLAKRRALLGDDHPDTLKAIASLTAVLWDLGYKERTRDLEEELLERRTRLLGRSHPDTVRIMKNFAITLNNLGETERAIALWNEAQGYEKKD